MLEALVKPGHDVQARAPGTPDSVGLNAKYPILVLQLLVGFWLILAYK
jgi:hypothetical protein